MFQNDVMSMTDFAQSNISFVCWKFKDGEGEELWMQSNGFH